MDLDQLVRDALEEDLPSGSDCTSEWFVPREVHGIGWIEARENAVVSGLDAAIRVFEIADKRISVELLVGNGHVVSPYQRVLNVKGPAHSLLAAERTALNFLCRLSGIATRTREFVDSVKPWGTKILCTRKTTPGWRTLEVKAVRDGGGDVYRTNLSDAVLLKDNHEGMIGGMSGVKQRLREIQTESPSEYTRLMKDGKIEASSIDDVRDAVEMGWSQILLDNMNVNDIAKVANCWGNQVYFEVSGGVTQVNIRDYAATGVHAISIGAITHSAKAADFSLEVEWRRA